MIYGLRTDVMNNCVKHVGINLMIRSMGPEIIATDEIGNSDDIKAILKVVCSGVKLLLTAHGDDISDIPDELINKKIFKNIIFLSKGNTPGKIKKIMIWDGDEYVTSY